MPKPRNLRNDVLPQLLHRHVVGDQRLIRIAGELHRRYMGMTESRHFLCPTASCFHRPIELLPIGLLPERLLDHGLDVEMPHRLFEQR